METDRTSQNTMPTDTIRLWKEADYPMLASWWAGHGWQAVPKVVLPRCGVIAGEKAAGFLYMDCSAPVSILEWLVTNPEAKPKDAYQGLKMCVEFLQGEAQAFGKPVILSTCKQESLAKFLEKQGFERTDEQMIHFAKFLEVQS
jgi:hypothetical protein